jgi:integrase
MGCGRSRRGWSRRSDEFARARPVCASQRKALLLLSGILKRAAVPELIPRNPVSMIQMPKAPPSDGPQPFTPLTVERIRQIMPTPPTRTVPATASGERPERGHQSPVGSPLEHQRNALIVSMLAYGSLRPIEDRSSRWADLRDRTLHVFASKTGRPRDIDLLSPLAQDLAEWRLACGRPADSALIVAPDRRGVDPFGLGQLAQPGVAPRRDGGRRHRRPAPVPPARPIHQPAAVVWDESRRGIRAGRQLRGHAGQALRRRDQGAQGAAPGAGGRGDPPGA